MTKQIITLIIASIFLCYTTQAQDLMEAELDTTYLYEEDVEILEDFEAEEEEVLSEAEFAIPSAPAFSLMGITPELVPRPGVVRNFKVDWRIRDYKGAPDLALEALPLWILFFNNDDLSKYRSASGLSRMLSTFSFSLSTASFNNTNHLGYAFKLNLFRAKDPLMDANILEEQYQAIQAETQSTTAEINALELKLLETSDPMERREIKRAIRELKATKRDVVRNKRGDLEFLRQNYIQENWNASMLDLAFGKIYTFDRDLVDSLGINNQGYGLWINGGLKSGRNGYISGIVKLSRYGETDVFQAGLSLRYGNPKYNFYLESMYERSKETIDPEFDPFTFKTTNLRLSYGGDFRLSRGILLNFSLQTKFDESFKFLDFLPIANLTCLMR